jgi:hypothetical protein
MELGKYYIARSSGKTITSLKNVMEMVEGQDSEGTITIPSELPMDEMMKRIEEILIKEQQEEDEIFEMIAIDSLKKLPLLDETLKESKGLEPGKLYTKHGISVLGVPTISIDTIAGMTASIEPIESVEIRQSRTEKRKEQRRKNREERKTRKNG